VPSRRARPRKRWHPRTRPGCGRGAGIFPTGRSCRRARHISVLVSSCPQKSSECSSREVDHQQPGDQLADQWPGRPGEPGAELADRHTEHQSPGRRPHQNTAGDHHRAQRSEAGVADLAEGRRARRQNSRDRSARAGTRAPGCCHLHDRGPVGRARGRGSAVCGNPARRHAETVPPAGEATPR
jgi:hypothetical protein